MNKTTADRPHDAQDFTPTRSLRIAAQATSAYRRIFASSPAAQILSRPNPVRYSGFDMTLDVKSVRFECADVLSVTLTPREGITLPSWIPGAHLDVILPSGRQRQYSLCGDPDDLTSYRIAVRRIDEGGGGSREIHESLKPGMVVDVRGRGMHFLLSLLRRTSLLRAESGSLRYFPWCNAVTAAESRGDWTISDELGQLCHS